MTPQQQIEKLTMQLDNQRKENALILQLADLPLPKNGLGAKINILTAKAILELDMAKNGLHVAMNESGNLMLKQRKDGADIDFFVDNKKADMPHYSAHVLRSNKFLESGSDQDNDNKANAGKNVLEQSQGQNIGSQQEQAIKGAVELGQQQRGRLSSHQVLAEIDGKLAQLEA